MNPYRDIDEPLREYARDRGGSEPSRDDRWDRPPGEGQAPGSMAASEASRRVQTILDTVEREAAELRHEARDEARRYLEHAQRRIDELIAERQQRIADVSDAILQRSEAVLDRLDEAAPVRRGFDNLIGALGDAAERLAAEIEDVHLSDIGPPPYMGSSPAIGPGPAQQYPGPPRRDDYQPPRPKPQGPLPRVAFAGQGPAPRAYEGSARSQPTYPQPPRSAAGEPSMREPSEPTMPEAETYQQPPAAPPLPEAERSEQQRPEAQAPEGPNGSDTNGADKPAEERDRSANGEEINGEQINGSAEPQAQPDQPIGPTQPDQPTGPTQPDRPAGPSQPNRPERRPESEPAMSGGSRAVAYAYGSEARPFKYETGVEATERPSPGAAPAEQPSPDEKMAAIELASTGNTRRQVEARLIDDFGESDRNALLDEIFGAHSADDARVPWATPPEG